MRTHIEGDPSQIEAAATYLRIALADGARDIGDVSAAQRNALADAWEGEAGSAFGGQARALAIAADDLTTATDRAANDLDMLAAALRSTHHEMRELRTRALAAGLSVTDTDVLAPLQSNLDPARAFGDLAPWSSYEVYAELADRHEQILDLWQAALDAAAATLRSRAESLALVGANLLSGAFSVSLLGIHRSIMQRQAQWLGTEADRLAHLAGEHMNLAREGRVRAGYGEYDDLMNRSTAAREASEAARNVPDPKFPSRFCTSLGVLTTGYGVYADIQAGESPTQAVVSQGVGLGGTVITTMTTVGPMMAAAGPVGLAGAVLLGATIGIAGDKGSDWLFDRGRDDSQKPRAGALGHQQRSPEESRVAVLMGAPGDIPPATRPTPAR